MFLWSIRWGFKWNYLLILDLRLNLAERFHFGHSIQPFGWKTMNRHQFHCLITVENTLNTQKMKWTLWITMSSNCESIEWKQWLNLEKRKTLALSELPITQNVWHKIFPLSYAKNYSTNKRFEGVWNKPGNDKICQCDIINNNKAKFMRFLNKILTFLFNCFVISSYDQDVSEHSA